MSDEARQRERRQTAQGDLTPAAARRAMRAKICARCGQHDCPSPAPSILAVGYACCDNCWATHCGLSPVFGPCPACKEARGYD